MFKKLFMMVVFVCGSFSIAVGEQVKSDTTGSYYLDEIVVTATRMKRSVRDLSATVSVVTEEDIEASNTKSCTDILNTLPGVFVNKTGDFGRADVDIRGLGDRGRSVMVLTDGRPVKMGLFGCTVTQSLPLNNVQRIEVVRGPSSVLYGSDALGGVINIITRQAGEGLETDFTSSIGSYNTGNIRLRHGGRHDGIDYYLTGNWRESDGHVPNSAYQGKDATLRIGYQITENLGTSISAKYFDGRKEEPQLDSRDPNYSPEPSDVWNEYKRGAVSLAFTGKLARWEGMARGYVNFGDHLFSDGWDSEDYTNGAVLHASGPLFADNMLTMGFDFRHQGGKVLSEPFNGEWDKKEHAVFFHDEQILMNRFMLTFGARYNQDELAGGEFCPQAGLVYHLGEATILRGSVNKGFRAPQINELYIFPPHNEELKSEQVTSYEVGLDQRIIPGLNVNLVGYLMEGDNLIRMEKNDSPPPMFKFQNAGEFEFRGIEAGLNAQPVKGFQARISYTHLDPGEKTTGRPGDKVDICLRCRRKKLALSTTGQYVTNYYAADEKQQGIPDYFIWDVKMSYEVLHGLSAFLAVDNIFDDSYAVYANLPGSAAGLYTMPRRRFTTGLNFRL